MIGAYAQGSDGRDGRLSSDPYVGSYETTEGDMSTTQQSASGRRVSEHGTRPPASSSARERPRESRPRLRAIKSAL